MIVPSMTDEEIQVELSKDYNNCTDYIERIKNPYRRAIVKSNKFPLHFKPVEYASPRKNKFLIFIDAKTKKDSNNFFITIVAYYFQHNRLYAAMCCPPLLNNMIAIYPPHFFERYRERYLKKDLSTIEIIKEFFKHNASNRGVETEENYFTSVCKQGFVFGETISSKVQVMKTFLTEDMLKGDQPILYKYFTNQLIEAEEFKKKDKIGIEYLKSII